MFAGQPQAQSLEVLPRQAVEGEHLRPRLNGGINTRRRHGRMQPAKRTGPAPRIPRLARSMSNVPRQCALATVAYSLAGRGRCPVDRTGVFSLHEAIIPANWCQAHLSTPTTTVVARQT